MGRSKISRLFSGGLQIRLSGPLTLAVAGTLLIGAIFLNQFLQHFYLQEVETHLHREGITLQHALRHHMDGSTDLQNEVRALGEALGLRITIIRPDGFVAAESSGDPSALAHHADRPEVQAALGGSVGRAVRYSESLDVAMLYVAVPVTTPQGTAVVRTALPLTSLQSTLRQISQSVLGFALGTILVISIVTSALARRMLAPLRDLTALARRVATGRFDSRIRVRQRGEIGQLATAFNAMSARLQETMSALSRHRAQLQAVVGSMAEAVIAVDGMGRVILVNPAAQGMFGVEEAGAIGARLADVFDNPALTNAVESTIAKRRGILAEIELDRPVHRVLRAHTALLRDEEGRFIGALALIYDVTELRRLERVRSDFVANVSHELRTPLTSIHGFVETLLDGAEPEPATRRRFLEIIHNETERIIAMINDLLDLSRLESEELSLSLRRVHLHSLIADTVHLVQAPAEEKGIALRIAVDDALQVRADEALLRQVIINLLDNALKYTPAGGGEIRVSATARGEWVHVEVTEDRKSVV